MILNGFTRKTKKQKQNKMNKNIKDDKYQGLVCKTYIQKQFTH